MNKIKLGYFSFGSLETPQDHQDYNTWHLYDHMPELVALPGFASGMRYVATPALIQARPVADASLAPSQYVTLYLIEEPVQQAFDNLHRRSQELHTLGRQRANRQTYLIGSCLLVKAYAAPRVLVAPEAVPFRPHTGVLVTVADILDRRKYEAVAQWLDRVHIPDVLQVPGVAGVYWFERPDASGPGLQKNLPPGRTIHVWYLDGDPLETLRALLALRSDPERSAFGTGAQHPTLQQAGRMMDV